MFTTTQFLSMLYHRPLPEGSFVEVRIDCNGITRFWCTSTEEVAHCAAPYIKNATSIWFGPGLRRFKGGRDIDVGWIPALWVDCDAKCFAGGTKAEALALLKSFFPAPSLIVDTGHGMQAYWVLEDCITDLDLARGAMRWLRNELSMGLLYPLDSVYNPSRVMRLPNTVNRKADPVICRTVHVDVRSYYKLADFRIDLPDPTVDMGFLDRTAWQPSQRPLRAILQEALANGLPGWVQQALLRPDKFHHGDTSALDWAVVSNLVPYLELGEVEALWMQSPLGHRVQDNKVQHRPDYRRRTIWKAHLKAISSDTTN